MRWMAAVLAWSWVRSPESALSCWFSERFGGGGKSLRRIGIVAVARKLLIACGGLWKLVSYLRAQRSKRPKLASSAVAHLG